MARQFLYVREAQSLGQNRGQRVGGIQYWAIGQSGLGTSWCAEFVFFCGDIATQGKWPLPRTGACEVLRAYASANGLLTNTPKVGDLYLYLTAAGLAHHVGIVTSVGPLVGIAGNTSEDGLSANGDRVAERAITMPAERLAFIRLP